MRVVYYLIKIIECLKILIYSNFFALIYYINQYKILKLLNNVILFQLPVQIKH
jgi:hypothetical protein